MTEGLAGRQIDCPRSPVRRPRIRGVIVARKMSLKHAFICTQARHTARLRAFSDKLNTLWVLFLTKLAPLVHPLEKVGYAFLQGSAVAREKSVRTVRSIGQWLAAAAAALSSWSTCGRRTRLNTSLLFAALVIAFVGISFFGVGLEVTVGGTSLGFVSSRSEFELAVAGASEKAGELLGRPYVILSNPLYQFAIVNKTLIFDREEAEAMLLSTVSELKQLYVLSVDGVGVAASMSYAEIRDMLDSKLSLYAAPGDQAEFYQDVRIEQKLASASLEMTRTELKDLVLSDIRAESVHVVEKGDTLKTVTDSYGISEDALFLMNPEKFENDGASVSVMSQTEPYVYAYDDHGNPIDDQPSSMSKVTALTPGLELVVGEAIPFLSVQVARNVSFTEQIPFGTEYVKDDDIFEGESRVASPGVEGELLVSARLTLLNGSEVNRTIFDTEVLVEPVVEVVAQGTRVRYSLGSFIKPYNGVLSSNYGNRYLFGRWEFHPGIDLAGPTGDSIIASDGGKVIFAGRNSGYGNIVVIDHENGYKTAYAHCSKILVNVGQMVGQGEEIAKVGNTGRSTGPHLHFEIRTKTGTVNPLKLIGK